MKCFDQDIEEDHQILFKGESPEQMQQVQETLSDPTVQFLFKGYEFQSDNGGNVSIPATKPNQHKNVTCEEDNLDRATREDSDILTMAPVLFANEASF